MDSKLELRLAETKEETFGLLKAQRFPGRPAMTALKSFARRDDLGFLTRVLEARDCPNTDDMMHEALQIAVEHGHEDILRYLNDKGANVNGVQDAQGTPMLISLVQRRSTELVRTLLEAGAHVNVRGNFGDTALITATAKDNIDCLKLLISHGADTNAANNQGSTALLIAAKSGSKQCFNALIHAGADVNATVAMGYTALMYAAKLNKSSKRTSFMHSLIQAGADVNAAAKNGYTTLIHVAAHANDENCIRLLIEKKADLNAVTKDGTSALLAAATIGDHRSMRLLIEAGADVNAVDEHGYTALMYVIDDERASVDIVCLLLKYGAHINRLDDTVMDNAVTKYIRHGCRMAGKFAELFADLADSPSKLEKLKSEPENSLFVKPKIVMMLLAAGEFIDEMWFPVPVPKSVRKIEADRSLQSLCRRAVRNHLVELDPHTNLFKRIPQLKLPHLESYVLYGMALEETYGYSAEQTTESEEEETDSEATESPRDHDNDWE